MGSILILIAQATAVLLDTNRPAHPLSRLLGQRAVINIVQVLVSARGVLLRGLVHHEAQYLIALHELILYLGEMLLDLLPCAAELWGLLLAWLCVALALLLLRRGQWVVLDRRLRLEDRLDGPRVVGPANELLGTPTALITVLVVPFGETIALPCR